MSNLRTLIRQYPGVFTHLALMLVLLVGICILFFQFPVFYRAHQTPVSYLLSALIITSTIVSARRSILQAREKREADVREACALADAELQELNPFLPDTHE
jgi:hypothetical protein